MPTKPPVPGLGDFPANDWGSAAPPAAAAPKKAAKKPVDYWGLGNAYGEPILLGVTPGVFYGTGARSKPTSNNVTTQDYMDDAASMYSKHPAEFQALQSQLAAAGFYGAKQHYAAGRWDTATRNALTHAVENYVDVARRGGSPVTFVEFLKGQTDATAAGITAGTSGEGPTVPKAPAPPAITLDDPARIRAAAQDAFTDALGRGATESELTSFVSSFQAQQQAQQGSSDQTTTTPDLGAQAMSDAQNTDPAAYNQNQENKYTDALMNMFLPQESQRANVNQSSLVPKA